MYLIVHVEMHDAFPPSDVGSMMCTRRSLPSRDKSWINNEIKKHLKGGLHYMI